MFIVFFFLFIHIIKSNHGDEFQYGSLLHNLRFIDKSNMICDSGNACYCTDEIKSIDCSNNEPDNALPNWNCHANLKYKKQNDLKMSEIKTFCTETYVNNSVYSKNLYKCTVSFSLNHDADQKIINDVFDTGSHILWGIFIICVMCCAIIGIYLLFLLLHYVITKICTYCRNYHIIHYETNYQYESIPTNNEQIGTDV
jgi:hypothetical protein